MPVKSVVLTKVNKVALSRKDQINVLKGKGDYGFLRKFVRHAHKKLYTLKATDDSITVIAYHSTYLYTIYSDFISRVDLENQSKAKVFYKIN